MELLDEEAEEGTSSEDQTEDQDLEGFVTCDSENLGEESLSSAGKALEDAEAELESSSDEDSSLSGMIPMLNPAFWMVPGQAIRVSLPDSMDQL